MKFVLKSSMAALALFMASPALATLTITTQQSTDQGDNILFGPTIGATTGTSVFGATQEGFGLTFTSTQTLVASGGQASISAETGEITNLTITPTNAAGFEFIEFNASNAGNIGTAASILVTGFDQMSGSFQQSFDLGSGANWVFVNSDANQFITSVAFQTSGGGLAQVSQVRVGAGVGVIPEPGTWAMMLLGFGAIGYSMRRRRHAYLPQIA